MESRRIIAEYCLRFIRDDCTILTHSKSQVVLTVLQYAANKGRRFNVVVTETSPNHLGYETAHELKKAKIPVKVILDSSIAAIMSDVDFVLVGAEGVVESGGIINRIGTYQMAIVAKAMNRPFYIATESYKFSRLYPLTQNDIPYKNNSSQSSKQLFFGHHTSDGMQSNNNGQWTFHCL